MYPNLKIAIFKRGIRQNHLARELGMNDAVLSKIIHGFREPSNEQKALLSGYLREDEDWLFERFETAAVAAAGASAGPMPATVAQGKEDGDS